MKVSKDQRLLSGFTKKEDAAIVHFPSNKGLVQTLDFLTPIVEDPYAFGQIAACNSLSDVYAVGGTPYVAMNIVCFPYDDFELSVLHDILKGGLSKIEESEAILVGGHSIKDSELKYGLSVSGFVDYVNVANNSSLKPGDVLVLTKPIGSGVLSTAIKAKWDNYQRYEVELIRWLTRLNKVSGKALTKFNIKACTDITGFGLIGHLTEMALASGCSIMVNVDNVPLMDNALDLASVGLVTSVSFQNKEFYSRTVVDSGTNPVLLDLLYDPQTSGGLLMGVPCQDEREVVSWLRGNGEVAEVIGRVEPNRSGSVQVFLC